jgi:hypothetical protein
MPATIKSINGVVGVRGKMRPRTGNEAGMIVATVNVDGDIVDLEMSKNAAAELARRLTEYLVFADPLPLCLA